VQLWRWELDGSDARSRSRRLWSEVLRVLARCAGCEESEVRIVRSANGKPSFPAWDGAFSLSHDDDVGLLAVAQVSRLGVDAMAPRGLVHPLRLARRVFGAAELAAWIRLDESQQRLALRERFCAIEATVKALDWRLWPALGGVHVIAGRRIRVPLRRANLFLSTGQFDRHSYAVVADRPIELRWMNG
jgi:4'-phosphopantetheinyl transferase EntD